MKKKFEIEFLRIFKEDESYSRNQIRHIRFITAFYLAHDYFLTSYGERMMAGVKLLMNSAFPAARRKFCCERVKYSSGVSLQICNSFRETISSHYISFIYSSISWCNSQINWKTNWKTSESNIFFRIQWCYSRARIEKSRVERIYIVGRRNGRR